MPHDQNTGGFYVAVIKKTNYVYFTEKKVEEPDAPAHGKIIEDILAEHLKNNSANLDMDMDEDKAKEKQSLKFERPEKGNKMQNFKTAENYTVLNDEDTKNQILEYYGLRKVDTFDQRKSAITSMSARKVPKKFMYALLQSTGSSEATPIANSLKSTWESVVLRKLTRTTRKRLSSE